MIKIEYYTSPFNIESEEVRKRENGSDSNVSLDDNVYCLQQPSEETL
jgi:hypothetical protein